MEISKKKIVTGLVVVGLLCGTTGVYAGTVIDRYKTPRGNIATVETEQVHKNRIGITVNGKSVKADTIYFNQTTYAPIREVANLLNAGVNYNGQTMSADIFTKSELLDLFGIKLQKEYTIHYAGAWGGSVRTFKMTSFSPTSNEFAATISGGGYTTNEIKGYLTEKKMVFDGDTELIYNGPNNTFSNDRYKLIIE